MTKKLTPTQARLMRRLLADSCILSDLTVEELKITDLLRRRGLLDISPSPFTPTIVYVTFTDEADEMFGMTHDDYNEGMDEARRAELLARWDAIYGGAL